MPRKAQPLLILIIVTALAGCSIFCKPDRSSTGATPAVRSLNSNTPALMTFVNQSDQPIDCYWIDFGGQRQLYKRLDAGGSYTQQTYLTHPWLITDANGHPWNVYLPEAPSRTVYLQAPNNAVIAR
jgi:hypothetical protein